MNNQIDDVAEIIRMFRRLEDRDKTLIIDLLQKIDVSDSMKLMANNLRKQKKVSPRLHQKA